MDERGYKENLKKIVIKLAQEDIKNYASQKGIMKYVESNVEKVIEKNIKEYNIEQSSNVKYLKVLKRSSNQDTIIKIAKSIRMEDDFKKKTELIQLANYLNLKVNKKQSYNQILRKIASNIYINNKGYTDNYVLYRKEEKEYYLDPEKIKMELLENYKSKTRNDMKSIAKLLNIELEEENSAEEIRKKVINYIIKEKISKK